jgi:hypothetical protein
MKIYHPTTLHVTKSLAIYVCNYLHKLTKKAHAILKVETITWRDLTSRPISTMAMAQGPEIDLTKPKLDRLLKFFNTTLKIRPRV